MGMILISYLPTSSALINFTISFFSAPHWENWGNDLPGNDIIGFQVIRPFCPNEKYKTSSSPGSQILSLCLLIQMCPTFWSPRRPPPTFPPQPPLHLMMLSHYSSLLRPEGKQPSRIISNQDQAICALLSRFFQNVWSLRHSGTHWAPIGGHRRRDTEAKISHHWTDSTKDVCAETVPLILTKNLFL